MTSFTDGFWNMLIFVGTVGSIIVLFLFTRNYSADRPPGEGVQSMGHKWDGDLEELNNPLPRPTRYLRALIEARAARTRPSLH